MSSIVISVVAFCCIVGHFWHGVLSADEPTIDNLSEQDAGTELEKGVYVLNLKNFDAFVNSKDVVMVEFYAPWCGHCKKLAPIYEEAANKLKEHEPPVYLAKVDATVETELAERFELTGYPSLKIFKKGIAIDYDGPREADGIVSSMMEYSNPDYQFPKPETLILTSDNFSEIVEREELMVVMFYAPWCGHCKKMLPEFEKAAKELVKKDPPVLLAKVDATSEKSLSERYGVTGYPTLKFFRKGKDYPFNSDAREKWSILEYIERHLGMGSTAINSLKELRSKITSKDAFVVIVAFFSSSDDKSFSTYLELVNEKRDDFSFYHSFDPSHRDAYKFEPSTFVIFSTETFQSHHEPKWRHMKIVDGNKADIVNFLDKHRVPLVGEYNDQRKDKEYKDLRPLVLFFCTVDWSFEHREATQLWRKKFVEIAVKRPELTFVMADDDSNKGIFSEFGFDESGEEINVGILSKDGRKYPMDPMEEFNADEVHSFIKKFLKGSLKPLVKSQPIPKKQTGPVTVVVGKSFKDVVLNPSKDVLIELYAPWCGHCKQLEPIYKELAKKLKSEKNLVIAKMDATANDSPVNYPASGYPTIYFAPSNKKESPLLFSGERTIEGLMEFINKNRKASKKDDKEEL